MAMENAQFIYLQRQQKATLQFTITIVIASVLI